jgi:hypothetical protein
MAAAQVAFLVRAMLMLLEVAAVAVVVGIELLLVLAQQIKAEQAVADLTEKQIMELVAVAAQMLQAQMELQQLVALVAMV